MAKVSFSWDGVKQMQKALADVGVVLDDTNPDIKNIILERAAKKWQANARNLAPIGIDYPGHKAGTLRASIYVTKGGKKQRGILMGVKRKKAPYAFYVEYGTSKMGGTAFFRPALLAMAQTFAQDIGPGVKELVERTANASAYHPPG